MTDSFKDWLDGLTWKCDICGQERPDVHISVHKVDITPSTLPPLTVTRNVKYCNDNQTCTTAAFNWKENS